MGDLVLPAAALSLAEGAQVVPLVLSERARCGLHGRPTRYGRCSTCTPFVYDNGGRLDAGFRGDAGDCVTRAIAIAAQLDYRAVYDALNAIAEALPRRGATKRRAEAVKTKPSSRTGHHRKVYEAFLAELGWEWTPTMAVGSGCQVHLRADELPDGRLVARLSKHLVAVVDGVVRDTYDPSRGGTRCVYGYWSQR